MNVESVRLSKIVLDPANARKHGDRNIETIKGSLARFGQQKPIVLGKNDVVIAGNGTVTAARDLGWDMINAVRTELEGTEATAFALADNRTAELAEWDNEVLTATLKALDALDFDLKSIGFDDFDLTVPENTKGLTDPDEVPEKVDTRCKPGDLWILGNHRLLCGDSTNVQHVERLMGGEKADITFTSPPYNAAKNGQLNGLVDGFEKKYGNNDDSMTDGEYCEFLTAFTSIAVVKSRFVFVNLQLLAHNRIPLAEYWYRFRSVLKDILIWNKRQAPPNIVKGAFNTRFEFVFCFSEDCKTRGFPADWRGQFPNVIETESNSGNEFAENHRAGFPVAFPIWFIEKFDFAKTVYEPFCGTGTTIVACEKLGRRCFGMELDPHYCDVILTRWEKFTGKTACRLDGETNGISS